MSTTENSILKDAQRGAAVEADGNAPTQSVHVGGGVSLALDSQSDPQAQALGPNNEHLEQGEAQAQAALLAARLKQRPQS